MSLVPRSKVCITHPSCIVKCLDLFHFPGPVQPPTHEQLDYLDDFDQQGQNLIGSLQLEADDEPVRRGAAASRANSVRFDESALQGANWGQASRHSADFVMELSLPHKSDGRHSSAGHSVHSMPSAPSGRASSLGLDTNFVVGSGDEVSPVDIPEPAPGLFILGTVPSIVRCWLTQNFGRDTLLYAVVCTGSHKSTVDHGLIRELELSGEVHRDVKGTHRIHIPVYLAEAILTQNVPRSNGASGQRAIPSITTSFEVINMDHKESPDAKNGIRVVLGSDTLRAHSADLLLSRNTMALLGDEREKLIVPFVRPEDEGAFKYLITANMVPDKPKLNANAPPFVSGDSTNDLNGKIASSPSSKQVIEEAPSPAKNQVSQHERGAGNQSENGGDYEQHTRDEAGGKKDDDVDAIPTTPTPMMMTENGRKDSTSSGLWGSWRQHSINGGDSNSSGPVSGQRVNRNMKILKPSKLSGSARTGASYEPPLPGRSTGELRRRNTGSSSDNPPPTPAMRWDSKEQKRIFLSSGDSRAPGTPSGREARSSISRSANPVGGASAFKWMSSPGTGSKASTAVAD